MESANEEITELLRVMHSAIDEFREIKVELEASKRREAEWWERWRRGIATADETNKKRGQEHDERVRKYKWQVRVSWILHAWYICVTILLLIWMNRQAG